MRVLVACEESQAVTIELRKLGHQAFSADIKNCSGGHPEWHIKGDVIEVLDRDWDMLFAHPPCTRLTNAGVRWLKVPPNGKTLVEMWADFFDGAEFYKKLRDCKIEKKAIENPVMHCHAREIIAPGDRQVVQPWWFGDKAFKATGFETIGLPKLKATNRLVPPKPGTDEHKRWSWIHRMPPGPRRNELRSKTFPGIAKAMAEQWAGRT